MDVKCPKCQKKFTVKVESQVAGGKARAKLWTFEERSKAMRLAWKRRKENMKAVEKIKETDNQSETRSDQGDGPPNT